MRNLPFHDMNQNRIWLAITALAAELLAWTAHLALPATAAVYEPKTNAAADPRHRRAARALGPTPRPTHRLHLALGRDDHHRPRPPLRTPGPLTRHPDPTTRTRSTGRTTLSR